MIDLCHQVWVYFMTPILVVVYTLDLYMLARWRLRVYGRSHPEAAAASDDVLDKLKSHCIRTILALLFLGYTS